MHWTAIGESVTGRSHQIRDLPCQDAFRYAIFGAAGEWLTIVAADGAGSASHSEVGATLTCDEIVRRIQTQEPDTLFSLENTTALFTEVREVIFTEAEQLNILPRELACTALLAVVGSSAAVFAQIGDGAIVLNHGQNYRVVFWPEPLEYANATDFLTDDSFQRSIKFETITDSVTDIAVFTDGLQRLALDFASHTAYSGFFRPLFHELRIATEPELLVEPFRAFLDSDRINERTDDDKTLVLAVRHR